MNFWDQNYTAPGDQYGTTPNRFLTEQGHEVHAVDSSQVGLDKAQALADERSVDLRTTCGKARSPRCTT